MKLKKIVKESYSYSEILRKINYKNINGNSIKKLRQFIKNKNIDVSHFVKSGNRRKYKIVEKECPVCNKIFQAQKGHKREKQTCSYSCSNTYFRSGPNNPNWKNEAYRTTCFYYYEKKCVICPEKNVVDVHHIDENKKNNDLSNLLPLCPTHHKYWHSRYRALIENKINNYLKSKKNIF